MESYIKVFKNTEINVNIYNEFIIIDGLTVKNKEDLLKPFFIKYNLLNYIGSYSLDTFEDIIKDYGYILNNTVKILIINYDKLLTFDENRKINFYEILSNLIISDVNIYYEIVIYK